MEPAGPVQGSTQGISYNIPGIRIILMPIRGRGRAPASYTLLPENNGLTLLVWAHATQIKAPDVERSAQEKMVTKIWTVIRFARILLSVPGTLFFHLWASDKNFPIRPRISVILHCFRENSKRAIKVDLPKNLIIMIIFTLRTAVQWSSHAPGSFLKWRKQTRAVCLNRLLHTSRQ